MARRKRRVVRTPVKQNQILTELRQRIVEGEYPPGSRLPLRTDLQQHYKVSTATLQSALTRLINDGFVRAQGRRGTFVCDFPPHLSHLGVAFPPPPGFGNRALSRFNTILTDLALELPEHSPHRATIYQRIDGHPDTPSCEQLDRDMRHQLLAGVLFVYPRPEQLAESFLMASPDTPRVVITTDLDNFKAPVIYPDMDQFFDRALDHLARQGCKRVGLVTLNHAPLRQREYFTRGAVRRGMTTQAWWMQATAWPQVDWATNVAQLMLQPTQPHRPDGLVIADDNLAQPVLAGVRGAGVAVGRDLQVVSHANFPDQHPDRAVRWLGFDVRSCLALALETVLALRQNRRVAKRRAIPPVFEDELPR